MKTGSDQCRTRRVRKANVQEGVKGNIRRVILFHSGKPDFLDAYMKGQGLFFYYYF